MPFRNRLHLPKETPLQAGKNVIAGYYRKKAEREKAEEWPELDRAWASAQIAKPELAAKVKNVRPMTGWEKFSTNLMTGGSGAYGKMTPGGEIAMNRELVTKDDMLRDSLMHELTHAGQKPRNLTNWFKDTYMTKWDEVPYEIEAMAAERNNPIKEKGRDTYLPIDTAPIAKFTDMMKKRRKK